MFSKLPLPLKSKKGFVGALLFFYGAVHGIFSLIQDATYAANNWGNIVEFLTSGLGNLLVIVAGILLILWAIFTQQPEADSTSTTLPTADKSDELEQLKDELRGVEQERDEYRTGYETLEEGLKGLGVDITRRLDRQIAQTKQLTSESKNERLEEELRKTKKERDELRAGQRQKRIEDWRSVIRGFDFDTHSFASTDTYAQMRPHLQPKVVKMFEAQRTVHIGNETRGDTAYGYTLLDEVARIEKEWGLI